MLRRHQRAVIESGAARTMPVNSARGWIFLRLPLERAAFNIAKNQPILRRLFKCKGLPRPEATLKSHGIECQD